MDLVLYVPMVILMQYFHFCVDQASSKAKLEGLGIIYQQAIEKPRFRSQRWIIEHGTIYTLYQKIESTEKKEEGEIEERKRLNSFISKSWWKYYPNAYSFPNLLSFTWSKSWVMTIPADLSNNVQDRNFGSLAVWFYFWLFYFVYGDEKTLLVRLVLMSSVSVVGFLKRHFYWLCNCINFYDSHKFICFESHATFHVVRFFLNGVLC